MTTAPADVALILAPPFIPDEPHLGLAYLASYLRAHDFRVAVFDFSIRLFHDCDPELRSLWDRSPGVAQQWQHRSMMEAVLNDHWHTFEGYIDEVLATSPAVVGFSCHMTNSVLSLELANMVRHRAGDEVMMVAGGPAFFVNHLGSEEYELCMYGHPTQGLARLRRQMEQRFSLLDGVVLDEGEGPLLEICQRARQGRDLEGVDNVVCCSGSGIYAPLTRGAPIRDLRNIPFPSFEEFDLSLYTRPQLPALFNRGCIKRCTCCTERHRWGTFRARKAEDILAELKHHVEVLGIRQFNACDMLLNANVRELSRLCDLLITEGLPILWGGNMVVRKEMDHHLFEKLKRAGLSWCIFGVESGSPRIVERIGKVFSLEDAGRNLRACHDAGIKTCINIIIGFPGETDEDFQQSMDFLRHNRENIDWVILMAMFEIFHHTEVAQQPEKYHLRPEDVENLSEMFGLVEWSDQTGNTYEVRQVRLAQMQHLLAELDLPDPTMQGSDLRRSQSLTDLARHPSIRQMVLAALEVDPTREVPLSEVLCEVLLKDEDPKLRAGAARLFGLLHDRKALRPLFIALKDEDEWVRGEAACALGRLGDPGAIPYLPGLLEEETFRTLDPTMQRCLARLQQIKQGLELEKAYLHKKFNRTPEAQEDSEDPEGASSASQ